MGKGRRRQGSSDWGCWHIMIGDDFFIIWSPKWTFFAAIAYGHCRLYHGVRRRGWRVWILLSFVCHISHPDQGPNTCNYQPPSQVIDASISLTTKNEINSIKNQQSLQIAASVLRGHFSSCRVSCLLSFVQFQSLSVCSRFLASRQNFLVHLVFCTNVTFPGQLTPSLWVILCEHFIICAEKDHHLCLAVCTVPYVDNILCCWWVHRQHL